MPPKRKSRIIEPIGYVVLEWWAGSESNTRHKGIQSSYTESRRVAIESDKALFCTHQARLHRSRTVNSAQTEHKKAAERSAAFSFLFARVEGCLSRLAQSSKAREGR